MSTMFSMLKTLGNPHFLTVQACKIVARVRVPVGSPSFEGIILPPRLWVTIVGSLLGVRPSQSVGTRTCINQFLDLPIFGVDYNDLLARVA